MVFSGYFLNPGVERKSDVPFCKLKLRNLPSRLLEIRYFSPEMMSVTSASRKGNGSKRITPGPFQPYFLEFIIFCIPCICPTVLVSLGLVMRLICQEAFLG